MGRTPPPPSPASTPSTSATTPSTSQPRPYRRLPHLRAIPGIRLNGTPWELEEEARALFEERFGAYWHCDED